MAGPERFELSSEGVKVLCLTAWLWSYKKVGKPTIKQNGGERWIRTIELVESGFTVHRV